MLALRKLTLFFSLVFSLQAQASQNVDFSSQVPATFKTFLDRAFETFFTLKGDTSSPLHKQIFQGSVSGSTYKKWFQARVKKIEIMEDCNLTAKIDSEGPAGVIYISKCANLAPQENEMFYWLSVLFHEARHLEPQFSFWRHNVCVNASGEADACDSSPLGSFGLEKVLAGNILKHCLNCDLNIKVQAQAVFDDSITWRKLSLSAVEKIEQDLK